MTNIIIIAIVSILIGLLIGHIIPGQKVKQKNLELEKAEQDLRLAIKNSEMEYKELLNKFELEREKQTNLLKDQMREWEKEQSNKNLNFLQARNNLELEISNLNGTKQTIQKEIEEKRNQITNLDEQAKQASSVIEAQALENATLELEQQMQILYEKYTKLESELLLHYTELADDKMDEFIIESDKLNNYILEKENELYNLSAKAAAITETNKRAELDKQQKDFYRLQLSDIDLEEIQRIRSIEPYLRKKEPLNKVIWKVYYEKPYTDLVGRVIGQGTHIGIYKITNLNNGMTYIGQSNNIAERWKQHIKRGVGADPPTQNKLYPAMLAIGVENFTFEIIEECSVSQLNEREKYYQQVYGAQEFGYSIR